MKTQFRGHCQICGRLHAVSKISSNIVNHGYIVENGYFNGICSGHNYLPMENDRTATDFHVQGLIGFAKSFELDADKMESGELTIKADKLFKRNKFDNGRFILKEIMFCDLPEYEQKREIKSTIHILRRKAEAYINHADYLKTLADSVNGKNLVVVKAKEPPEPIEVGHKCKTVRGLVFVCTSVEGPRVYWKTEITPIKKGWISTRKWRSLEKVS